MRANISETELNEYSPITLAYIGDAVFELMVRQHILLGGKKKIRDMHKETVALVKAETQARIIREIYDDLSEAEQLIVKRGRNAKNNTPKNTSIVDYLMSTGFEALLGYLYLKGDKERLNALVEKAFSIEIAS